jgi:hypothetical protein
MMKKIFITGTFAACFLLAHAQQKKCSCSFEGIAQVGLLQGQSPSAFQAQSINGIKYKTWFAGAGIGIDNYMLRIIPLFVDLRKNILNKESTPYAFTDIGIGFPWLRNDQENMHFNSDFSNGLYYNLGLGYRISMKKKSALLLSTAFSLKHLTEERYGYTPLCENDCQLSLIATDKHTLRRLSLAIGISF